ncbi:MAG: endolytic transglycosylase MltG [Actinomycetota bacterium]|jgi:UPF0755 protein|nr:endolytic transglycosylase MltG [Actinomycetota bacterium]
MYEVDMAPLPGWERRRHVRWGRLILVVVVLLAALLLVVGGGAYAVYSHEIGGSTRGPRVDFVVGPGDSFSSVADRLASSGVVHSGVFFRLYVHLHPQPTLRPGTYVLHRGESVAEVLTAFRDFEVAEYRYTVIPGMTLGQIAAAAGRIPGHTQAGFAKALEAGGYQSPFLASPSSSLEGLLSPNTYFVLRSEADRKIIQQMLDQTTKVAESVGLHPGSTHFGLDPYQILTVASLIQREALQAGDYPKVARVIYNRLAAGMNLQLDSTVLYGLHLAGGSPTLGQLKIATPYNTYLNQGLPPTPISAPSRAAIAAALNPTPGPWLYFVVVKADGAEAFSTTYQEQLANENLAAQRGLG